MTRKTTKKPADAAITLAPLSFDTAVRAALATGKAPPPKGKARKPKSPIAGVKGKK